MKLQPLTRGKTKSTSMITPTLKKTNFKCLLSKNNSNRLDLLQIYHLKCSQSVENEQKQKLTVNLTTKYTVSTIKLNMAYHFPTKGQNNKTRVFQTLAW